MIEAVFAPPNLVLAAGIIFTLGYLIINQVVLRLAILTGTGFYIAYYATVAETPLWEAIYTSISMAAANLIGLASLYARNAKWSIPADFQDIYPQFDRLEPGDFRSLVQLSRRYTVTEDQVITQKGAPTEHLYYIISGSALVHKTGETFEVPCGILVGEVAYLAAQNSVATTTLKAGSEILEWSVSDLRAKSRRKSRFKLALEAMISIDLVRKVAVGVAPRTQKAG